MAKIYVTIMNPSTDSYARLKIGRLPIFRRTINSGNYKSTFEKLDIPLNKKLIVSDKPFSGSNKMESKAGYGIYYNSRKNSTLSFCGRELRNYFKDIPDNLYWKRA